MGPKKVRHDTAPRSLQALQPENGGQRDWWRDQGLACCEWRIQADLSAMPLDDIVAFVHYCVLDCIACGDSY
eukprot:3432232-Rhodomonas_salina.1